MFYLRINIKFSIRLIKRGCKFHIAMEKYKIQKTLGDGAFGVVYKAVNTKTNEIVAIKKMKRKFESWDECKNLREIKSLMKLNHDCIIKLKEVLRVNDELHLVFEFLEENLFQCYQKMKETKDGRFSEKQIKSIIYKCAEGLSYMHKHGFFHRDMKPENILVHREAVKIADFGLAREIRSRPPFTDYVSTRWYRAPEILLKATNYNSPVDIFALGCIMAELYMMSPLFAGSSEFDQMYKICSVLGTPTQVSWPEGHRLASQIGFTFPQMTGIGLNQVMKDVPLEAINLISDMLRYDPQKRPTAQQILQHPYFSGFTPGQVLINDVEPLPTPLPTSILQGEESRVIGGSPQILNKVDKGNQDQGRSRSTTPFSVPRDNAANTKDNSGMNFDFDGFLKGDNKQGMGIGGGYGNEMKFGAGGNIGLTTNAGLSNPASPFLSDPFKKEAKAENKKFDAQGFGSGVGSGLPSFSQRNNRKGQSGIMDYSALGGDDKNIYDFKTSNNDTSFGNSKINDLKLGGGDYKPLATNPSSNILGNQRNNNFSTNSAYNTPGDLGFKKQPNDIYDFSNLVPRKDSKVAGDSFIEEKPYQPTIFGVNNLSTNPTGLGGGGGGYKPSFISAYKEEIASKPTHNTSTFGNYSNNVNIGGNASLGVDSDRLFGAGGGFGANSDIGGNFNKPFLSGVSNRNALGMNKFGGAKGPAGDGYVPSFQPKPYGANLHMNVSSRITSGISPLGGFEGERLYDVPVGQGSFGRYKY